MTRFAWMLGGLLAAAPAAAAELAASDAGTFAVLDRGGAATQVHYRLSHRAGAWHMEGKLPDGDWKSISCDRGCEYRPTTAAERDAQIPEDWRSKADFACIQNTAQAFCKYVTKADATRGGYVVIALVTGAPIPMFLRRVAAD